MSTAANATIKTLGDVMSMMAPFAGGSIPDENSADYSDWRRWIQQKQNEYAMRAFWRRCLTREEITIGGDTTVLPDRFHKPNGLYVLSVDDVDWNQTPNADEMSIFIEMNNDTASEDFGNWQMRFSEEVTAGTEAIMWYFANPPLPTASTDILLLPGDMIGYAALGEYFRQSNQEGSQDKAESDAEARFQEYLMLEVLPDKSELLVFDGNPQRINRLATARSYYTSRSGRNTSW